MSKLLVEAELSIRPLTLGLLLTQAQQITQMMIHGKHSFSQQSQQTNSLAQRKVRLSTQTAFVLILHPVHQGLARHSVNPASVPLVSP